MLRIALVAGVLAGASALASGPAQAQEAGYRCPAAGTTLERTRGDAFTYRGDGAAPFLCATSTGAQRFLGYWQTGETFYASNRGPLEQMMTAAFEGAAPSPVSFTYFSHSAVGYIPITVQESWSAGGTEAVSTPAGSFNALRVERVFQIVDSAYRYRQTLWLDRQSGVPVRVEVEHLNGIMATQVFSWQAAAVHRGHVASTR
nr:hypothetical protein [uncultured Roseococcus sp.]